MDSVRIVFTDSSSRLPWSGAGGIRLLGWWRAD
jgi:hypothetical protein